MVSRCTQCIVKWQYGFHYRYIPPSITQLFLFLNALAVLQYVQSCMNQPNPQHVTQRVKQHTMVGIMQ